MHTPRMYDLAEVMDVSNFSEEEVLDLGISGELSFLVVVPEIGACRVPPVALSHFMAGAEIYEAEAMPEHWSGALSGKWTIKRDRLRILVESWESISVKFLELADALDSTQLKAEILETQEQAGLPHGIGPILWTIENAAAAIATQEGWSEGSKSTLAKQMLTASINRELIVRHPLTDLPVMPEVARVWYELVTPADVNAWLEKQNAPYAWNIEISPDEKSLHESGKASKGITKEQAVIAFGDIVQMDLRKAMGNGATAWINEARVSKGTRGNGRHSSIWNPVILAVAMHERRLATKAKLSRAFFDHSFLAEWREAWNEQEADLS